MKIKIFSLIFLLICIVASDFAVAQKKYEDGKIYRHTLPNGLVVITMERHIAPYIYHQLTYRVGSRNERLGITGISHVVEHMMFKGTKKYPKGEASKTISKNGGVFNAFTMNDMTSYYEYMPKNKIEIAMDIESDRMQNSIFDPKEFQSEIEVIIQERRMRIESSADGLAYEYLNAIAYDSHPNRDPIIGWPQDLRNITREDAYTYYKTFYTPNNAFLVLIGDFETESILKLVEKYYGNIPPGPNIPKITVSEQDQKVKKTFTLKHSDISQPRIRLAFHVPTYEHPDAPVLRIIQRIFSERSRTARLYKRLVEKEKLATSASGGFGLSKDPTLYQISISLRPGVSVDTVEKIFWEEVKKLQDELVPEKELQKAKNRHRFDEITAYTKNADIGSRLSRYEAYFNYEFIDTFSIRVMKVSREDIQRVMRTYFDPSKVTIGYLLPKDDTKKDVLPLEEKLEDEIPEIDGNKFYFNDVIQGLEKILQEEDLNDIIKPNLIAPLVKTSKLKNGITLYTIENRLLPTIFIGGVFQTGLIEEAIGEKFPGIVSLMCDVMNRGPKGITYDEFTEQLAFVPFQFSMNGNYQRIYFQGYALKDNLDDMINTGLQVLTNPRFDENEIEELKNRYAIRARESLKQTSAKAFYYMFNKIFRDHPYSQNLPTEESIRKISKSDLINLWKKYLSPDKLSLVILGDFTHKEMQNIAEKYFGNLTLGSKYPRKSVPPVKELDRKEIKVFNERDYTQCTINIGFAPFNDVDTENEEAVDALNHILASSTLTSRMGVNLRDKQGLIYGLKSELWSTSDGIGYWKFNTKTAPENVNKVIKGIFHEIRLLLKDGLTDAELLSAKRRLLSLLPLYVETPDDIATRVFEFIREGKPLDYFDKKAERILKLTKEDLMKIAQKYFTLDRFIIVIDGPINQEDVEGLLGEL